MGMRRILLDVRCDL